jgi:O-6-methylguanine DNA methyltransferase
MTNRNLEEVLASFFTDAPETLAGKVFARWTIVSGPVGDLFVASTDEGVSFVRSAMTVDVAGFVDEYHFRFHQPMVETRRPPAGVLPALRTGRSSNIRFDLRNLSAFDQDVLHVVQSIPKGQVRPYSWVAYQIGRPKAVRAVGSALHRNPVPVLIPCHRVVRSDGSIGEYVFGSSVKRRLLDEEGTNVEEMTDLGRHGVHYIASDTTGVVCFPTCSDARRITADHRHGFRTVAGAQEAGYRPCQHCRPVAAERAS